MSSEQLHKLIVYLIEDIIFVVLFVLNGIAIERWKEKKRKEDENRIVTVDWRDEDSK